MNDSLRTGNIGDQKNQPKNSNSNKISHFELLQYSQDLKQEGKSMSNESKKDFLELSHYSAILESHLYWETREQYLKLLKNGICGATDSDS